MHNLRFYIPDKIALDERITLSADLAHRLIKVLRLQNGAQINLFNNHLSAQARLNISTKKSVVAQIIAVSMPHSEPKIKINLGQVMICNNRMDYLIQKSVELGVALINPLTAAYCNLKLTQQQSDKKINQWQKIALAACEQSFSTQIPLIEQVVDIAVWLKNCTADIKLICDPSAVKKISSSIANQQPSSVAVLVGSEGGFTIAEIKLAKQYGFILVSLGPRVLRAETAPIVVMTLVQYLWG